MHSRYILAAVFMALLPFLLMLTQSFRVSTGTELRLPVTMERVQNRTFTPQVRLLTPLNNLSTSALTGDNNFKPGSRIFVFLSGGPNHIWYPYAVSKRLSKRGCNDCLILSGRVISVGQDRLNIAYAFEHYIPSKDMFASFERGEIQDAQISLSVANNGNAVVKAVHFDGETISQPILILPKLSGLMRMGASMAPAQ